MKRLLVLLPILLLSGCLTSVPVKRNFPEVPADLKVACPDLKETPDTTKLSEVIGVVVDNYSQYHECRVKVDSWIEWYNTQKDIFDSVK
jgi:hypothetical protein